MAKKWLCHEDTIPITIGAHRISNVKINIISVRVFIKSYYYLELLTLLNLGSEGGGRMDGMFPEFFTDDVEALVQPDHFRRVFKKVHLVSAGDQMA